MKLLLLGQNGQLGSDIKKKFKCTTFKNKLKFNYKNLSTLKKLILITKPDIIINCIAFTDVNKAEKKSFKKKCFFLNSKFPEFLSNICYCQNIKLFHFSTDYVFNGKKKGFYTEKSLPNPINYYGKTKLSGEKKIILSGCKYYIFRISWLYNMNFKKNFVYKIKKKILSNKNFLLPVDQFGSTISSNRVAHYLYEFIKIIKVKNIKSGIYNLTTNKPLSRLGLGRYISKMLNKDIKIDGYKTSKINRLSAKRPHNSRLSVKKIEKLLKLKIIDCKKDLKNNIILK